MAKASLATLTLQERIVFEALKQNADDCSGGDFAITEEINYRKLGLTGQAFGALLTTLQSKRIICVDVTYVNGNEKVTQATSSMFRS